jgi:hypothetical protein
MMSNEIVHANPVSQNLFSGIMVAFGGRRSAAHLRPSKFDIRGSALMLC